MGGDREAGDAVDDGDGGGRLAGVAGQLGEGALEVEHERALRGELGVAVLAVEAGDRVDELVGALLVVLLVVQRGGLGERGGLVDEAGAADEADAGGRAWAVSGLTGTGAITVR